jgi:predicted permease
VIDHRAELVPRHSRREPAQRLRESLLPTHEPTYPNAPCGWTPSSAIRVATVPEHGATATLLLNATLGNLAELVIPITALRAGDYMLVKASIAGAIVTKTLFILGGSLLLGGLKHQVQEFNRTTARFQASLLFLGTAPC